MPSYKITLGTLSYLQGASRLSFYCLTSSPPLLLHQPQGRWYWEEEGDETGQQGPLLV